MRLRSVPCLLLAGCVGAAFGQEGVFITPQGSFPFNAPNGAAQQQPTSAARHTVAGTVVNSVTGEPIRRALVRLNGLESHSAFTGQDGRFEIPNVPEGNVFFTTQKPGYFDAGASPGPQNGFRNPNVMLGPSTGDIVLKLMPEAKIHGRVLDKRGEPIESVSVQLLAQVIMEGLKQWQIRGQATTDDAGAYTLDNLVSGVYAIHTLALAANGAADMPSNGESFSEVFPPTYYPDAPDRSSVQPLEVKPGQELAIDLTLSPVSGFRVSGVVAGGQPGSQLICEDADGQPVSYGMGVNPHSGKFTLTGIPPGAWTLHAFTQPGQEGAAEAEQDIEVSSSDIKGLVLQLQPLPSIAVHVRSQSEAQGPGVMVNLTRVNGNQMRNYVASQEAGGAPGSLFLNGIPPGTYRVSARAFNNECVASVMSGSSDLTREQLTVSAGSQPAPIEVTLRNDCATISGMVHSSGERPGMSSVILLSDSPLKPPDIFSAGSDGKFSIPSLTPGEYRVFAFSDISDLEYGNPEALRDFPGQDITVGANEKANVQLDLITRGK